MSFVSSVPQNTPTQKKKKKETQAFFLNNTKIWKSEGLFKPFLCIFSCNSGFHSLSSQAPPERIWHDVWLGIPGICIKCVDVGLQKQTQLTSEGRW